MGLGNIIGFSRMDLFTINELVLVHFLSISEFQILAFVHLREDILNTIDYRFQTYMSITLFKT